MAEVTGLTAEAMQQIANETITSARIDNFQLILSTREGTDINLGKIQYTEAEIDALVSDSIDEEDIPGKITLYLSQNGTVVAAVQDAAGPAITAAMVGKQVLEAGVTLEENLPFSIADEDGRRSWLEVALDGGPTDNSVSILTKKIYMAIAQLLAPTGMMLAEMNENTTGLAFALTDEDGRQSWLEVGPDGGPTARTMAILQSRLNVQLTMPVTSGPNLVVVGHSMSAQATSYVSAALSTIGRSVVGLGVGGEGINTVSSRWGSHPSYVLPVGGTIPASGAVQITLSSDSGTPLLQGPATYEVSLQLADGTSIAGTFGKDGSGNFTFTRSSAGSAIAVTRPIRMRYTLAELNRSQIPMFWAARNGSWTTTNAVRERLDRMEGMIQHMYALDRRFVVLSEHISATDTTDTIAAIKDYNKQAYLRWGRNFIDTQQYLIDYGLLDAAITEQAQDAADRAAGIVPTSLRGDALHLNAAGCTVVASLVKRRILENGW